MKRSTKTALIFGLLALGGLVAFFLLRDKANTEPATTPAPAPTLPTDFFPKGPEITDPEADLVRDYLAWTLQSAPYETYTPPGAEAVSWLTLYTVSSGIYDRAKLQLPDGKSFRADVVYAFLLTQAQQVLTLPVVIGFETGDGVYAYLSDGFLNENELDFSVSTSLTRAEALADAQIRLARGVQIRLNANEMVSRSDLRWDA